MKDKRWSVGQGATGVELGRFDTEAEAAEFIDTLDPTKAYEGAYWLVDTRSDDAKEEDMRLFIANRYAHSWRLIAAEHDRRAFEANKQKGTLLLALQLVSTAPTLEEAQSIARKYLA